MVLYTLEKTFGSCRAFHDHMEELTEDKYADEFLNIVRPLPRCASHL